MPKLNAAQQQAASSAPETASYGPFPEGIYTIKLREVTIREGNEAPQWNTDWEVVADAQGDTTHAGRRLFENISTSEKAAWKMRQFFDAMGYTYDSDTDEMIGDVCQAVVVQRPIERGKRAGQVGNEIERFLPLPDDGTYQADAGAPAGNGQGW